MRPLRTPGALVACGLLTGTLIAGCGSGGSKATDSKAADTHTRRIATHAGTLDAAKLEQGITASASTQRHAQATVDCPSGIGLRAKARFYCVAEVGSRNTAFLITERDAEGDVAYRGLRPGQAPLIDSETVANAIKNSARTARHIKVSVSCPTDIPRQRGLDFVCLATKRDAGTTQFLVAEIDNAGNVRYRAR